MPESVSPPERMFRDRVVVVTGGAHGIGAAALGGSATAHRADVTDAGAVATMATDVLAAHARIDVLVNNAGHWVRVLPFHRPAPEHTCSGSTSVGSSWSPGRPSTR